jgi:hypothetical protein
MSPLRPAFLALALALPAVAEERGAPEYSARRLGSAEPISLASLRGQVVLLNTWATWWLPLPQGDAGLCSQETLSWVWRTLVQDRNPLTHE